MLPLKGVILPLMVRSDLLGPRVALVSIEMGLAAILQLRLVF